MQQIFNDQEENHFRESPIMPLTIHYHTLNYLLIFVNTAQEWG